MINKIKGLIEIKEIVEEMSKKFENNANSVIELTKTIESMKLEVDSLRNSQKNLVKELKSDSESIKELKNDFQKEITDFKLVKSRLEKTLVEKFEEEIKEDLLQRFDRLDKQVQNFENLGGKVAAIANRVVLLSSELQKFTDISEELKKVDF